MARLSRFAVLTSDAAAAIAPDPNSIVWLPARAALGDAEALLLLLALSLLLLGIVMAIFSPRFADTAIRAAAQGVSSRCRRAHQGVPRRLAPAGAAPQGIRPAAARSLADLADA